MQTNDFQQRVLERLDRLAVDVEQTNQKVEQTNQKVEQTNQKVDSLATEVEQTNYKVDALTQELALTNTRVDTYQKASNQVVNLAFGLIATATVTIIASVILK
ncbi:MAG: hypothetical protein ACRDEA_20740 [Microcystaceae cyanobacterium]